MLGIAAMLVACERSQPSASQITEYIENYQIAHDYSVASMNYDIKPEQGGQSGSIQVSGKLELREPLYVEDLGNKAFRKSVAKMLRRNRFSEREINHEIYDRVIRAVARVQGSSSEYHTFLKEEHAPGYAINFSANLIYTKGNEGFMLDGPVRHPKLLGARIIKFTNPVVDASALVNEAVKSALAEQTRYREMMKESSALLSRLWDNDFGFVLWNRKVPYLGTENLSPAERKQLSEFSAWRGVYRISNVKPVQYRTPHASNFFELGSYTTEGVATCLRQTGFIDELIYAKSKFDQYCEFGKQYPVRIELASVLNETNDFIASVKFEVNGVDSGEFVDNGGYFQREQNELGRYSDQQRVSVLDQAFDIKAHNRPVFNLVNSSDNQSDRIRFEYTGETDYYAARFEIFDTPDEALAMQPQSEVLNNEVPQAEPGDSGPDAQGQAAPTSKGIVNDEDVAAATVPAPVTNKQQLTSTQSKATSEPLTKKELITEIQLELKRLSVYQAPIDGIAGEHTFWSMAFVQKQLDKNVSVVPSEAFLAMLRQTPESAITPPVRTYNPVASKPKAKKKRTVAGNALRWAGGLFSKKERERKSKSEQNN